MTTAIVPASGPLNLSGMDAGSAIQIPTSAGEVIVTPKDIIEWIAPGAPVGEAIKFLVACRSMRLNPLLREAYLVNYRNNKTGENRWSTIVAKAGYLKCAKEQAGFDGHESGIIAQPFDFEKKQRVGEAVELKGTFLPTGMVVIGGWAKVYIKRTKIPVFVSVSTREYAKNTPMWESMPCTMIAKVALVAAIREAFPNLSGYDESELGIDAPPAPGQQSTTADVQAEDDEPQEEESNQVPDRGEQYTEDGDTDVWAEIESMFAQKNVTAAQAAVICEKRGVKTIRELPRDKAEELAAMMRERINKSVSTPIRPESKG